MVNHKDKLPCCGRVSERCRGGRARRDWNGIHYKQGMSAKNVGTTKLSANIATIFLAARS
jgi:hypothetical protein